MGIPRRAFTDSKEGYGKKRCPKCGDWMVLRTNKYGRKFWGCSNYICDETATYIASEDVLEYGIRKCPKCGREMAVRHGTNGEFWSCTGYPHCCYTEDYKEELVNNYDYISYPRNMHFKTEKTGKLIQQPLNTQKIVTPEKPINQLLEECEVGIKKDLSKEQLHKEIDKRKQLSGLYVDEMGGNGIHQPDGKMTFKYYMKDDVTILGIRQAVANCTGVAYIRNGGECGSILFKESSYQSENVDRLKQLDISSWNNIQYLDAAENNIVGLTRDGKIRSTFNRKDHLSIVNQWDNIANICCGSSFVVGVTNEGETLICGDCLGSAQRIKNIKDIQLLAASRRSGKSAFLAITSDGSLYYKSLKMDSETDQKIKAFGIVSAAIDETTIALIDIENNLYIKASDRPFKKVQIAGTPYCVFTERDIIHCLSKEGKVYTLTGNLESWPNAKVIENVDAEINARIDFARIQKLVETRKQNSLCPFCGGTIKGLFKAQCTSCGRKKNSFDLYKDFYDKKIKE